MSNTYPQLRCVPIKHGSPEYAATVALRNEVLRKPLGLSLSDEQLQAESGDHHLAGFLDGRLVACLVLTPVGTPFIEVGLPHVAIRKSLTSPAL
ncbi:MAG: hypothetical protein R6X19_01705 [Kiritimatiellia bacterium]